MFSTFLLGWNLWSEFQRLNGGKLFWRLTGSRPAPAPPAPASAFRAWRPAGGTVTATERHCMRSFSPSRRYWQGKSVELYGYEATWLDNLRFTGPGKRELCFSSISKVFPDGAWPNLFEVIN